MVSPLIGLFNSNRCNFRYIILKLYPVDSVEKDYDQNYKYNINYHINY